MPASRTDPIGCLVAGITIVSAVFAPTATANVPRFVRGDVNLDGKIEITDGIVVLQYLFVTAGRIPECLDAADADDSGVVNLSDGVHVFRWLFSDGPPPPPPSPRRPEYSPGSCGIDPTDDNLHCLRDSITCQPRGACCVAGACERTTHDECQSRGGVFRAFAACDDRCNENGLLDACEPDCNGNGYPDPCDIAEEHSSDCDLNGIPDECDPDANANGTPDACE